MFACGVAHADEDKTQQALRANLVEAKSLDIDYRKCAAVILSKEIGKLDPRVADTVYVSVIGEDPDQPTLKALRRSRVSVQPASTILSVMDKWQYSDHKWFYTVSSIRPSGTGEYTALGGYFSGPLCSARIAYRAKKSGDSCEVISSRVISVS